MPEPHHALRHQRTFGNRLQIGIDDRLILIDEVVPIAADRNNPRRTHDRAITPTGIIRVIRAIRKREREYQAKWSLVQTTAKRIKFQISEKDIANHSAAVNAVNRLLKDYTELRWKEDIGNGIFFRKEKFYNGDYNWRLLWILANGEKVGTMESTNVMHLLYRYRRDGDRSETLFFPFISIQKDGADSKVSFLWRFFQLKEEKGKIGGYFLFIPF